MKSLAKKQMLVTVLIISMVMFFAAPLTAFAEDVTPPEQQQLQQDPPANPPIDQPPGDQPSGDQPSGDQPSGDQPSGDQPSGDQPSGDFTGEVPVVNPGGFGPMMLLLFKAPDPDNGNPGAIWTSDNAGKVNINLYESKQDVHLNGGPKGGGGGLPDGEYYIKVTTPDDKILLGYNNDDTVTVASGIMPRFNLWNFLLKASDDTTGFDTTTNKGGEYKVWASKSLTFSNDESKTDNFKVKEPRIDVTKTASPGLVTVGNTITYSYTITNTGNVDLTNITLSDDKLGTISLNKTSLSPDESITVSATHVALVSEIGTLTNIATASGNWGGVTVTDSATASVSVSSDETPPQTPLIDLTKNANPGSVIVGNTITYSYTVTNTGNVDLTNITLSDDKLGTISVNKTSLSPGESTTGSANHVALVSEIGILTNTATASGNWGEVTVTDSATASVSVSSGETPSQTPQIDLTKTASPGLVTVGNTITYSYTVTNTGNVDLTNITLSDDKLGTISLNKTSLSPGESITVSATHVALVSEIGTLTNIATASGNWGDVTVTDSATASVTVSSDETPPQTPLIDLTKNANPGSVIVGNTITYSYTVTNTGNVDLTNITLSDDKLGTISLNKTSLSPGESITVSATHVALVSEIGTLTNIATASGNWGDATVTDSATASVTVRRGGGGGGDDNDNTPTPPIIIPNEPTPGGPVVVPEEPIPAGPLPQTGGFPAILLYGLGALLTGGGAALKLKKK